MNQQIMDKLAESWATRAAAKSLKPGTIKYRVAEVEFFMGAMATMEAMEITIPPIWVINIQCGRPICPLK